MIIGDNDIDFEKRNEEFLKYKDTLPKEPEGNVKKEYYVGCYSGDDWKYVHEILTQDGTLEDNIPQDSCECCNDCRHSETRGIYLLTDTEAEQLRNHPRVHYVNINVQKYPGTYLIDPSLVKDASKENRYSSPVKHGRQLSVNTFLPSSPGEDLKNRCGYQLLRHIQQSDPWVGDATQVFENQIQQWGTGKNVDVIVCDEDMWFGHIEFQNNLGGPENYIGGNVLPGNGTCDLLDLILDSPYYLDSDFFNADPNTRLMTRWDGTIVPVESYARNWWSQNSLTYRSSKFVSPSNGGTAVGVNDFGSIQVNNNYTRQRCNGSNTEYHSGQGSHGTSCASQAYGRQYGWAYNANKWFLNLYGSGSNSFEVGFDLQKIFHQVKPINSLYGTKDPTISSNSWGLRESILSSGFYYHRPVSDGIGGVSFSGVTATNSASPSFMTNHYQTTIRQEYAPSSMITAGDELINSGIIFVCSAGNTNQKLVKSDHPDYNNYYSVLEYTTLGSTITGNSPYQYYRTINRQGFPGQIGSTGTGQFGDTSRIYKTISVGALSDGFLYSNYEFGTSEDVGKELAAYFSNKGNLIDCYIAGAYTLAACDDYGSKYNRYDSTYTINGQQSVVSYDTIFNGTSSSCPIACGLIATKLEYNRDWTYADVKNWITNTVGAIENSNFYYGGGDLEDPNDIRWKDPFNLQTNLAYVLWDAATGNEKKEPTDISLSSLSFNEGISGSTTVATISATDPDAGDTFTFSLVSGAGSTDNDFFTISGNQLRIKNVPDYETKSSYSIRIRATDSGSLTYEEQFTLTVNDINEQTESFGGGLDAIRFATGNGLVFRGVIIKYT